MAPLKSFCLVAALGLGLPTSAFAQNPSPLPEWVYSGGVVLMPRYMDEIPKWQVMLGLSGEILPKYEGSHRYRGLGGPMLDIRYKDLAFLSTGEGLGVNFIQTDLGRVGFAITYDLGRSSGLSQELDRLGDVDPTPEAKLFAEAVLFPVVLRVNVRRSMGGYNGWAGDFGAYMPVAGWKNRLFIFAGPSLALGDQNYMERFFGITEAQSEASGYPVFIPGGGFKSVSFGISATWLMGHHWFINVIAAGALLLNDANRSPTTAHQMQGITGLTVAYRF
jgi:outer membrane scaffolding protein for murein synthesis (MipA/OmpV family)